MINDIPCVILSGGKSSRMKEDAGIDKAYLDFWGEPLYFRQFQKFSQMFSSVYISAKTIGTFPKIPTKNIIEDLSYVEDFNTTTLFAPTLGMLSAFENLKAERIFFIGVDTPFTTKESIKLLLSAKGKTVTAKCAGKVHPTVGIYDKSVASELTAMIKENKHKLTLFLDKIGTIFVDFTNDIEFSNLNRYEDYERVINNGVNPFR